MNTYNDLISQHDNYALIKTNRSAPYSIRKIDSRSYVILEDYVQAMELIAEWLKRGIEIFESDADFTLKYPSFSASEQKARGMIFWWDHIPSDEWPKDVKTYFEGDSFWQEFNEKRRLEKDNL